MLVPIKGLISFWHAGITFCANFMLMLIVVYFLTSIKFKSLKLLECILIMPKAAVLVALHGVHVISQ